MPAPTIPRRAIKRFSKAELNAAHLCALALWYGIDYATAKDHISDAELLDTFAAPMYMHAIHKNKFAPPVFANDIHNLIKAGKMHSLFRCIAGMNYRKGVNAIYKEIYPIFINQRKNNTEDTKVNNAVTALEKLSNGLVSAQQGHRLSLASRILFYLTPNLHISNMNNSVAKKYGLPVRPYHHYSEYFELFAKGLIVNQTLLSKYKLPSKRDGLGPKTWEAVNKTNWWHRRILDLAVLLDEGVYSVHPLLIQKLRAKIQLEKTAQVAIDYRLNNLRKHKVINRIVYSKINYY